MQQGRYRPSGRDATTAAQDMAGLLFDVNTRDKRVKNIQAAQANISKTRQLVQQYEAAAATLNDLSKHPHLMRQPAPPRASIVNQAKEKLAQTPPSASPLAKATACPSAPSMFGGMGTAAVASMPRAMAHQFAAAAVGSEAGITGIGLRAFAAAPKDPRLVGAIAAGVATGYAAHKGYENYQQAQEAAAQKEAARREDLAQGYQTLQSTQGQRWMQQNVQAGADKGKLAPSTYNPRTDKGKERITVRDTTVRCEGPAEELRWKDRGVDTQPAKVKILSTPIPEQVRPIVEGFDPAPVGIDTTRESFNIYDGPQIQILTRGKLPDNLPEGAWLPPEEALDKVPDFLEVGILNKKGEGYRWQNKHGEYGIRIDKGDPASDYPHQKVDHVRVTRNGQVIGRDGVPILTTPTIPKPKNAPDAHIPLEEWLKWTDGLNK